MLEFAAFAQDAVTTHEFYSFSLFSVTGTILIYLGLCSRKTELTKILTNPIFHRRVGSKNRPKFAQTRPFWLNRRKQRMFWQLIQSLQVDSAF